MITKPFDKVVKEDIDELVANGTQENRQLDYKEALSGNSDSDKKEFLADVSSFANSSGGWLIYGIQEKRDSDGKTTGVPEKASGLKGVNPDGEIRRLESMLQDGIEPRITGTRIKSIPGFTKGPVILIYIPKSWNSPHMIAFQRYSKFYARNNGGKYQLDLGEIRSAVALSETLPEKIKRFREDRVAKILADETPVLLRGIHRIVLHLIPISSMTPSSANVDLDRALKNRSNLTPIYSVSSNLRHNFDGILSCNQDTGYLQLFRSGIIEAVESSILDRRNTIPDKFLEPKLYAAVDLYLKLQQDIGISPPIIVLLTLIGVKGYSVTQNPLLQGIGPEQGKIDRDILALPDIMVDNFSTSADIILRPAFDTIWQASGFQSCPNYDQNGRWRNPGS